MVKFVRNIQRESLENEIDGHYSYRAFYRWNKEIETINISEIEQYPRLKSLRFLISCAEAQIYALKEAYSLVNNLIEEIESDKKNKRPRNISLSTKFILKEIYSSTNRHLIDDLRRDLISIGKLSKDDPNNSQSNFRAFFRTKKESDNKEVKPIRFIGYATELKHLVKILTGVLIDVNYSSHSNYHIAFSLFVNQKGEPFKVKKVRWDQRPSDDRAKKIEGVVSSLKVRTPGGK